MELQYFEKYKTSVIKPLVSTTHSGVYHKEQIIPSRDPGVEKVLVTLVVYISLSSQQKRIANYPHF